MRLILNRTFNQLLEYMLKLLTRTVVNQAHSCLQFQQIGKRVIGVGN